MQLASSVAAFVCTGSTAISRWALGLVLAGMLVVGLPTRAVRADTILDSGTTTVSTGTNFGGILTVGFTGTATLEVIAGGYATNSAGYLGYYAGSDGTATVSSGTWANGGNLVVGINGIGTLNVTGGSVTSSFGFIGSGAGSVGNATVSSGTWANGVDLTVGNNGTATLTMSGGLVSVGGTLSKGGNGTINLNSGGTLQIGTGTTGGVLGVAALTNNGTLIFNRSNASTYSGIMNGTGAVTKQGAGTLTLDGANSYSGLTTISGGTLQVGNSGTTGSIAGNVVNNSTLIFNRSDDSTYSGIISGSGVVTKQGGGTMTLSGNNSFTGGTTINDGVLALGNADAVGTSGTISFGGGTLQYSASNTTDYSSRFSTAASQAYTIDTNGQNVTWASPLASSGGTLTKSGTGALTLAGANSYSGVTTISGGVLALSGTGSIGTGDLNLGSGGVFDLTALTSGTYSLPSTGDLIGSGTLTGNGHTLAVLGAFQPGNSPGTVTVDTGFTLDLSGATSTTFEITDPLFTAGTYDLVNGNGSLIFGGILNLAFSGGSYADGTDVLQLFSNTGGFSGDFASVVSTGLAAGQAATFNAATGFISITAVPEPSTYAMALAGLASGGWQMFRRRRLRQAPSVAA